MAIVRLNSTASHRFATIRRMGNVKTPPPMPAKLRGKYDVSPHGMTVALST